MDWLIAFLSYQITEPLPLSNNSQTLLLPLAALDGKQHIRV